MANLDALIIGAGPAGLNAALVLAQAQCSVLVIDAGEPRNAPAAHLRGFLTRDGMAPTELLELGREEIARFGAQLRVGSVVDVQRDGEDFVLTLSDDSQVRAPRVLVTTGLRDELPAIDGVAEQWGRGVAHCPFCHGYEVHGQAIGVIATSEMSVHQVQVVRQWSDNITYFTHTQGELPPEQQEIFDARGITVVHGEVVKVVSDGEQVTGVQLTDGTTVPSEAVFVATRMVPRDGLLAALGVEVADTPVGRFPVVDVLGGTNVPRVWAAGNVVDPQAQVIVSAAAGYRAATAIVRDVIEAKTAADLERLRAGKSAGK
ncbi:MAG: NAD(P)/FAD-dependent oxidoreductase [Rhodococcus sp.]|nr:NAD(P)/FAD-dependent oxidoreductase [Rhodococcus sp. (in: high G+C Gram-positive bacteria)]